jgi:hypothetical protein
LAIPYASKAAFGAAGYTDFVVGDGVVAGKTRQFGHLSFTRVFNAGHNSKLSRLFI